jgi:hypothetical protein
MLDLTFMLGIDGHFECIFAKLNFRNIDPLAINVVFIYVITANGNSCIQIIKFSVKHVPCALNIKCEQYCAKPFPSYFDKFESFLCFSESLYLCVCVCVCVLVRHTLIPIIGARITRLNSFLAEIIFQAK